MSNKWLYDVEVFSNCFLCSIKNYKTKEIITWEISDRKTEDENKLTFVELFLWWDKFKGYLISFNGIEYDNSIMLWILKNKYINNFNKKLKEWSDYNIKTDFWWKDYPQYKYHNQWIDIDLFCYWSRNLRLSKKISLKSLAIQLNWGHIQELPYPHDKILTSEEIDELIKYNVNNDLGILEKLTEVFEGKTNTPLGNLGTIQLRQTAKNKYGIDCFSWDAPKIAAEVLSIDYCKKTNTDLKEFKKLRFEKDSFQFKDLFEGIDFNFTTKTFQNLYNEWMNSYDTFSKEFVAFTKDQNHGIKISVGAGGIHNCLENEIYEEDENIVLYDTDIAGMYPESILNLHCFRFKELEDSYLDTKLYRINETKPNLKKYKGTDQEQFWKNQDLFAKVNLNGISGMIDMSHSPLYNNKGAMKMRVYGQLVLCYLTERLLQNNIQVFMINTKELVL